jgi:acyl-CoA thioester hydrolase
MHESIRGFRSVIEIPVAWGDMDAAQHVNNTVYLRYGETSRIEFLRACEIDFDIKGSGVILGEINCKYKFPLTFPDKVWVGTRAMLDTIEDHSFWTEQIIVSQKHNRISAIILAKLVYYDFVQLKKSLLSDQIINNLHHFEK